MRWVSRSKNVEMKINENVSKDSFAFSFVNPRIPLSHTFFLDEEEKKNELISSIKDNIEIYLQQSDSRLSLLSNPSNSSTSSVSSTPSVSPSFLNRISSENNVVVGNKMYFKIPNYVPVNNY